MSAPTDYTPGYPTAAATAPAETSDTAGEAYTSDVVATAITTWVTETVNPDCSTVAPVETTAVPAETTPAPAVTTPAPVESTPAPAETTPEPAATNTCACPAPDASAPPVETSDTEGESWVSSAAPAPTDGSEVPEYAGESSSVLGLFNADDQVRSQRANRAVSTVDMMLHTLAPAPPLAPRLPKLLDKAGHPAQTQCQLLSRPMIAKMMMEAKYPIMLATSPLKMFMTTIQPSDSFRSTTRLITLLLRRQTMGRLPLPSSPRKMSSG
jgi:hypothetical protein